MTFQPVVPFGGYLGWQFLQRTMDAQQTAFKESAQVKRDTDYFRENIVNVRTAEELADDRRLLSVALGAFGLEDDINNRFFIRKILEDGTTDPDALGNRLADKRYFAMSQTFGLGLGEISLTSSTQFADRIIADFQDKQFARAVGESDENMRLALNVDDGLQDIIDTTRANDARWFSILGNAPLRRVIETALGLPSSIASIDLDQQLSTFKDRARSVLGSDEVADLASPERQEDLIRLFLVRAQAQEFSGTSSGTVALNLLRSAPIPYT